MATKIQINAMIRKMRPVVRNVRVFPKIRQVFAQFAKVVDSKALTVNTDGDMSHPAVTDWYVAKFCVDNHYAR